MEAVQIFSFILVASLLVISPGPNGVLIAKTVPSAGKAAGFANIAGFILAFYLHGSLSILGISVLLLQSAQAFFVFKMLGAAYLAWIGGKALWQAWRQPQLPNPATPPVTGKRFSLKGAFVEGLLTNLLNPKVSMFYLAAFPQFVPFADSASSAYLLVSLHALLNLVWFSAMILLLARLKQLATSPRFTQWLKSVTGTVFIAFAAKLALLKPLQNS